MIVLVCGSRNYNQPVKVHRALDALHARRPVKMIIHGAANGADRLGAQWAKLRTIPEVAYPAKWEEFGKGAGPRRNVEMLARGKPDLVVAFPGGVGTHDMIRRAKKAGIPVWRPIKSKRPE